MLSSTIQQSGLVGLRSLCCCTMRSLSLSISNSRGCTARGRIPTEKKNIRLFPCLEKVVEHTISVRFNNVLKHFTVDQSVAALVKPAQLSEAASFCSELCRIQANTNKSSTRETAALTATQLASIHLYPLSLSIFLYLSIERASKRAPTRNGNFVGR